MELLISQYNDYKIIKLSDKIDWADAKQLDEVVRKFIEDGFVNIVFDLTDVNFICSGGIGSLVYSLGKVKKLNGGIYIISNNSYIDFIFETLKFDVIFEDRIFLTIDDLKKRIEEQS